MSILARKTCVMYKVIYYTDGPIDHTALCPSIAQCLISGPHSNRLLIIQLSVTVKFLYCCSEIFLRTVVQEFAITITESDYLKRPSSDSRCQNQL